jgi:hypothetical protein
MGDDGVRAAENLPVDGVVPADKNRLAGDPLRRYAITGCPPSDDDQMSVEKMKPLSPVKKLFILICPRGWKP